MIQLENLRHKIRLKSTEPSWSRVLFEKPVEEFPICLSKNFCNISLDVYSAILFEVKKRFLP
jgi:hypothetical protein